MGYWTRLTLLQRFTIASAVIAAGLAVVLSLVTVRAIQAFAVEDEEHVATELVLRTFAPVLRASDFADALPEARRALFDALFRAHGISDNLLRVRLWRSDGRQLYSNRPETNLRSVKADLSSSNGYRAFVRARQDIEGGTSGVARVFVPVRVSGDPRTLGAFEIFYDLTALEQRLARARRAIWTAVPAGHLVLYGSVFVLVRRASRRLLKQQADLVAAHLGTYHALASALDLKDSYTGDHSATVASLATHLSTAMGLPQQTVDEINVAARLHDLGKIGVPDAILGKRGPLTPGEHRTIRRHSEAGYNILRYAPVSDLVKLAVRHTHERWDGGGYPDGLAGDAIPLGARIIAVVDAYEAMTSERPYRKGMSLTEALTRLQDGAGTHFDPDVVAAFVDMVTGQERRRRTSRAGETEAPPRSDDASIATRAP
jgi:HD-GYP domain-containing protein (c-di-GMP phosphodiesterase class II)